MIEIRRFFVDLGDDFSILARIQIDRDNAKSPVLQADLTSITRKVYLAGVLGDTDTLTIADVIFDTIQTGTVWTKDTTGFNFKDALSHTLFAAAGEYRVQYTFVLTGSTQFVEWFYVSVRDPTA